MSNTHEYVVFDRAKLDPALALKWPAFEKAYPQWFQWESARDFLVEWGLGETHIGIVDDILARRTVRWTLLLSDDPFHFLWAILNEKELWDCYIEIEKWDYDYGDDIVSCAGAGFVRGELSLASLTAVYHLHASCVDPSQVLTPDVASVVKGQPGPLPILPGLPDLMPPGADGIGVAQARRVIDFLLRAWREWWPLYAKGQTPRNRETIRCCEVAVGLAQALRKRRLAKPCIFRWYES